MYTDDVVVEKLCELWSVGGVVSGDEVCYFGETVDDDEDGIGSV